MSAHAFPFVIEFHLGAVANLLYKPFDFICASFQSTAKFMNLSSAQVLLLRPD